MKKRVLILAMLFLASFYTINAQSSYGIKAGLSYNTNGELTEIFNDVENFIDNKGSGKSGFNIGFYGKLNLGPIYLRPELVYTKTTSEYILNSQNEDFKMSKLDMPVLVGFKVFGPLDAFIGPSFQYILKNDFKDIDSDALKNDITVGLNLGFGIELGKLGIDIRYERGFSSNEASFIDNEIVGGNMSYTLDTRPEQFIVNLSYRLSTKKQ